MKHTSLLYLALSAALLSLPVAAQPGPGMGGMVGTNGMAAPDQGGRGASRDCGKARDPERCEALQKAKEICKDKVAAEKKQCMQSTMPPMDCSKARNPQRCEDHQKAKEACKDKTGREHRQCMKDNLPKRGKGK